MTAFSGYSTDMELFDGYGSDCRIGNVIGLPEHLAHLARPPPMPAQRKRPRRVAMPKAPLSDSEWDSMTESEAEHLSDAISSASERESASERAAHRGAPWDEPPEPPSERSRALFEAPGLSIVVSTAARLAW